MKNLLEVRDAGTRGRGVFATKDIPKGSIVEVSPVILLPEASVDKILDQYVFLWDTVNYALALGLGSLFNHSSKPNMNMTVRLRRKELVFRTRRLVKANEEMTHSYGYEPIGYDSK
jgi:tRNA-specific adenosine deaminase 3